MIQCGGKLCFIKLNTNGSSNIEKSVKLSELGHIVENINVELEDNNIKKKKKNCNNKTPISK